MIEQYRRLLGRYGSSAVSCADGASCRICGMRVTVQDLHLIKLEPEDSVITCKSCGRILYLQDDVVLQKRVSS